MFRPNLQLLCPCQRIQPYLDSTDNLCKSTCVTSFADHQMISDHPGLVRANSCFLLKAKVGTYCNDVRSKSRVPFLFCGRINPLSRLCQQINVACFQAKFRPLSLFCKQPGQVKIRK